MRNYVYSALIVNTVFAVFDAVLPLRKNGFYPYVKYVMGLILVLVIALPLLDTVSCVDEITECFKSFFQKEEWREEPCETDALLRETASRVASAIADILCEEYGVAREDISIDVKLDDGDMSQIRIISVTVRTKELPPLLTSAYLSSYFSQLLGCDVSVN